MELDKVREFCAVRKLECSVLVPVNEIPDNLIIRALSYDFIKKPIKFIINSISSNFTCI